jgi:hypothetical protein
MYAEVPGVTCTIKFCRRRIHKKDQVQYIDDQISGMREQVMLALMNPQAVLPVIPQCLLNIVDNEAKETVLFAMQDSEVETDPSTAMPKLS